MYLVIRTSQLRAFLYGRNYIFNDYLICTFVDGRKRISLNITATIIETSWLRLANESKL